MKFSFHLSEVMLKTIGNLRTTTKFTTTTSVDWEKTGTRTSVSAGKRKVKMRSVGRSTTTTLNVNTDVKLWCSFATKFFAMASFKTTQDLICSSRTSNFIDDEKFFVLSDLFEWKYTYFPYEIIQLSTWMRWPSPSVRQSLDFEKETFWCDSCFPYKVYFLYIKDIWFALPKYVQINLSQFTYEFARSASSAVAILQSKINSLVEFSINIAC